MTSLHPARSPRPAEPPGRAAGAGSGELIAAVSRAAERRGKSEPSLFHQRSSPSAQGAIPTITVFPGRWVLRRTFRYRRSPIPSESPAPVSTISMFM